jgi:hypothetical protein
VLGPGGDLGRRAVLGRVDAEPTMKPCCKHGLMWLAGAAWVAGLIGFVWWISNKLPVWFPG